ncbi:MAG: NAD(P)-dependent oxidoreductase [Caldilineaceae bacterium]
MNFKVGFIGVGRMGGPMAHNIHKAGFEVAAYDVVPAALKSLAGEGIQTSSSRAEIAAFADVIILMLPSDDALQETMEGADGLLGVLRPGQIVIDMSTSKLATSRHYAQKIAEQRAHMLDAPVSGGTGGAQNGTLSIMVGGDPAIFDQCRPVLQAMGKTVTRIGDHGMGLVAKLVNQMLMEATFCAVAESFAFAVKAGADVATVYEAVRNGLAGSKVLDQTIETLLSGNFGTGRELTLHYKDGGYALDAVTSVDAWAPITELSHKLFTDALAAGQGEKSAPALVKLFEEQLGVKVGV